MYLIFFSTLLVFVLKFNTHTSYLPSRYIYSIFPIYTILFSTSIYFILSSFKQKQCIAVITFVFFAFFINVNSFKISATTEQYLRKEKEQLYIDNIGVGVPWIYDVISFIKEKIAPTKDTIFVFGGKFNEFIYYLDLPMDGSRCVFSSESQKCYNISKNTYVESYYFKINELKIASENNPSGFYITRHDYLENNDGTRMELGNTDFIYNNKKFNFINNINYFKIYKWDNASN